MKKPTPKAKAVKKPKTNAGPMRVKKKPVTKK